MMIILSIVVFLLSTYLELFINSWDKGDQWVITVLFGLLGVAILWLFKISRDMDALKNAVNLIISKQNTNENTKSDFEDFDK